MNFSGDPYYAMRDEVQGMITLANRRFGKWKHLLRTVDTSDSLEFKQEHEALLRDVESIQKHVNTLSLSIKVVETRRTDPIFRHIDEAELETRRRVVMRFREQLEEIRDAVSSPQAQRKIDDDERKSAMRHVSKRCKSYDAYGRAEETDLLIADEKRQQAMLAANQEEHLDELHDSVLRLGHVAGAISTELDAHNQMITELHDDVDDVSHQLDRVTKRIQKLLQTQNNCQFMLIVVLTVTLVILMVLVVVL